MKSLVYSSVVCLAFVILAGQTATAQNWPGFRGPNADGVGADHPQLPLSWSTRENVNWVEQIAGWGWSCPVVWENMVFLTSVVADEENTEPSKGLYLGQGVREPAKGTHHWMVYCLDLNSGKLVWKHEAHAGRPLVPRHPKSTYAAETAVTDGERLYVLFGDLGLFCYDLTGKPIWKVDIAPQKTFMDYGAAASPVVHEDQVFVVYDNFKESWLAAFDTETGKENWRVKRNETHSWATPYVWKNELRTEIVVPGKRRNRSYGLDGELLWEFDGRMSNLVIPSPFAAHGMCYIASGYIGDPHRPTFAIRPGGSGDLAPDGEYEQSQQIAWYQGTSSSYNPSQIVYGDYLYTLYDRGFLTCHDARTGKEVYGKRRFTPRGSFTASPWAYNGHLFFLSEDGLTYVVKAGPEFKIVGRNQLSELSIACPAVAGDKLLVRTASRLYCLTKGARLADELANRVPVPEDRPGGSAIDIWSAASSGNLEELQKNVSGGVSVDARNKESSVTPLMNAALYGHEPIVRWLLQKKAAVNLKNRDGNTALHMASFMARPKIVGALLESNADRSLKNNRQETPLAIVSTEWNARRERVYKYIGNLLGIEIDLVRIKESRPAVIQLLQPAGDK